MMWFREFDLQWWQMREALGYSIPDRIDRRFPKKLAGNGGVNPFVCGVCEARRLFPVPNHVVSLEALREHDPEAFGNIYRALEKHRASDPALTQGPI